MDGRTREAREIKKRKIDKLNKACTVLSNKLSSFLTPKVAGTVRLTVLKRKLGRPRLGGDFPLRPPRINLKSYLIRAHRYSVLGRLQRL